MSRSPRRSYSLSSNSSKDSLKSQKPQHLSLKSTSKKSYVSKSPSSICKSQINNPNNMNFTEFITKEIGQIMLWNDIGLSALSYPLDRANTDMVCRALSNVQSQIEAVWIVAKPINNRKNRNFHHWCIKIQASPHLISIDFLQYQKQGSFKYEQVQSDDTELVDFLHYYYFDKKQGRNVREKWKIIASITPSPIYNTLYLKEEALDEYDMKTLKKYMTNKYGKNKNNQLRANKQKKMFYKQIQCPKKVCDIACFIDMWTDKLETKGCKKSGDKGYNVLISNCQQFAAELFEWLFQHQKVYDHKVDKVFQMLELHKPRRRVRRGYERPTVTSNTQKTDSVSHSQSDEKQNY